MTTTQDYGSSFGTIVFTTNIPGDKEHTLDPTNISYSNFPDINITNIAKKIYFHSDKLLNSNFFRNKTRPDIISILFNKNRFEKITGDIFDVSGGLSKDTIITTNILKYIEHIFTTFPKSNNIKNINNINNSGGLKLSIPFTTIPYTYLKVNGTEHTVSRVVYYDDKQKDKISLEIINDYNEFDKWYRETNIENLFTTPLINELNNLFDTKMTKNNLYNTFGKNDTPPDFEADIKKYQDDIEQIYTYIKQSDEIPSGMWTIKKFTDNFFVFNTTNKRYDLFTVGSKIYNTIVVPINDSNEMKLKIEKKIEAFKKVIQNANILKEDGRISASGNQPLSTFIKLVKPLLKHIEEIIYVTEGNRLWLDLHLTSSTPNPELKEQELINLIDSYKLTIESKRNQQKIFTEYNGSTMIAKILSNLSDYNYKGTFESARTDEEINNFKQVIITIYSNYMILNKLNAQTKKTYDDINTAYNATRTISDQLKQMKKPVALGNTLFPSHKFKYIIELLDSFQTHSDIYISFINKIYNVELLKYKYSKYNKYKQYIDFIQKIKNIYEYNPEFKLAAIPAMIKNGELVKIKKISGFENESIRLHIDLIRGKVNDENIKQIDCEYKDNDLVERWNKLDEIEDDNDKLEPMYYFKINDTKTKDTKQIKKGGRRTKKRRHKKSAYTRKQ